MPVTQCVSYLLTTTVNLDACAKLGFKPTVTLIIVGKRHHVRFFPCAQNESDRSGNCVAGTVVDSDVVNPVEFDFYLLSHGGILGTSRPAHYNVLIDENRFTCVTLDISLARKFTMLTPCPALMVYNHSRMRFVTFMREPLARSRYRHLFIVMLVHCIVFIYYHLMALAPDADIVCSRAKHHYDPQQGLDFSASETATNTADAVAEFRQAFIPTHNRMKQLMYFC